MNSPSFSILRRRSWLRVRRDFVPPLLVSLAASYWLSVLVRVFLVMPLGGDQGIFHYIAFALRHGDVMYRDIREVNGPGTAVIHVVIQWLGGRDPMVFRALDLTANVVVFAGFGAAVPGLVGGTRNPESALPPSAWARFGWALIAVSVLLAGYLRFDFWSTAQRESFAMWFLLPSLALQLNAQATFRGEGVALRDRRQRNQLVVAGALTALTWFIKPTFGLLSLAQLAVVAVGKTGISRWGRLLWFGGAAVASAVCVSLLLLPIVDFTEWFRLLGEARRVYRFMWNKPVPDLWTGTFQSDLVAAHALAVVGLIAVPLRVMPPRMLCVLILPFAAVLHVTLQHKGFAYHYAPVVLLVLAAMIVLVAFASELALRAIRERRLSGFLAALPLMWLAFHTAENASASSSMTLSDLIYGGELEPRAKRGSDAFYKLFQSRHTPFADQERAGWYLRKHTAPADRLQVYGRDPWVLYLAERLSATPFMYITDFNMVGSLSGSGYNVPSARDKVAIKEASAEHDRELLAGLTAAPPARFVFVDVTGLVRVKDSAADFVKSAPLSGAWFKQRYEEEKRFGPIRIWKPKGSRVR